MFNAVVDLLEDPDELLTLSGLGLAEARSVEAITKNTVPDMPDRIIAATSLSLGIPLVSADHKIQALSIIQVIWL